LEVLTDAPLLRSNLEKVSKKINFIDIKINSALKVGEKIGLELEIPLSPKLW
jgi:hypothetical protein